MMGLCTPVGILPTNSFFYCQDNWLLIGLGAIVLIILAALVVFAIVTHFTSLMEVVHWWNEGKEREEKTVEELAERIQRLEAAIKPESEAVE